MSKPNGRQKKAIENLAAALNECFDAAVEAGEVRARESTRGSLREATRSTQELLEAQRESLREATRSTQELLEAQNATLRMIWRQCGGNGSERLPIDE